MANLVTLKRSLILIGSGIAVALVGLMVSAITLSAGDNSGFEESATWWESALWNIGCGLFSLGVLGAILSVMIRGVEAGRPASATRPPAGVEPRPTGPREPSTADSALDPEAVRRD